MSALAHESIYESGHKPDEINREADTTKSSGAGAPCDLVAPPGEARLAEVIRRGWPGLNERQAEYSKKYLTKRKKEGDSFDMIAAGLERHLAWAEANNRKQWDLMAIFRDKKYNDRWETRPEPKAKEKPKATPGPKSKLKPHPKAKEEANIEEEYPHVIRFKPLPAAPTWSISEGEVAALTGKEAMEQFESHLKKGDCQLCSQVMKKLLAEGWGFSTERAVIEMSADTRPGKPGRKRTYMPCQDCTRLTNRIFDYLSGEDSIKQQTEG